MDEKTKQLVHEASSDLDSAKRGKILKAIMIWLCLVLVFIVGGGIFYKALLPKVYFAVTASAEKLKFPDFVDDSVSEDVKSLLILAKNEYEDPKPGEYYAEGVREPWCADFVSWLYKEAGHPFRNPNTGHWRIPGIYTLKEYLQSMGAWHSEPDYVPQLGDIVVYDGGLFGGHTNMVVGVDEGQIIVLGGNENNQIRLDKIDWTEGKYGVRGFGHIL